jgi:hypothetical protein
MLTLTKKTWKYIFYAVIAMVLLYVIFGSTRERFTSVNPIPTAADFAALKASFDKEQKEPYAAQSGGSIKLAAKVLKTAPESIKAVIRFSRANIIPLLPYNVVKNETGPDGSDGFDYITLAIMPMYKDFLILPLAYTVKQQSSPPTLSAFVDMVVKIAKDNAPGNQPLQINAVQQGLIDQAKNGETTIQMPNGDTYPNPGYWAYKYVYGDQKSPSSSTTSSTSTSSKTSSGSIGGGGKCTPSVLQIPGGVTETRCFSN